MSKPTFVVDWDGTVTEDSWPAMGMWLPDAPWALHEMLKLGNVVIDSCRMNPYEKGHDGELLRPVAVTHAAIAEVRAMLDSKGLHEVRLHTTPGKPPGDEYIDNKGRRYLGRPKSWRVLIDIFHGLYGKEAK